MLSAAVIPVGITPTPGTAGVPERTSQSIQIGTFTDVPPGSANDYSVQIDWGDGTTSAGTVTTASLGTYTVSGTHAYADEGAYTATASITETVAPGDTGTVTGVITAAEDDTLTGMPVSVSATEGGAFSGAVATFSDSDSSAPASDFAAIIDWGDGTTTAGTVGGSGPNLTVSGSHAYIEDGSFTATVTLSDDNPGTATGTVTGTVTVTEAPIFASGTTISGVQGTRLAGKFVAGFTDANPLEPGGDETASIFWGDGTSSPGMVVPAGIRGSFEYFAVFGSHTYGSAGKFAVEVGISDDNITEKIAHTTAKIAPALGPISARSVAASAVEGEAFSNKTFAEFNDGNPSAPASDFTASIAWGDGTTGSGRIVSDRSGGFYVRGSHDYAEQGKKAVKVSVKDNAGHSASAGQSLAVSDAPLTPVPMTTSAHVNQSFTQTIGAFLDGDQLNTKAGGYMVTINWGDGSAKTGGTAVFASAGHWTVKATHKYTAKSPLSRLRCDHQRTRYRRGPGDHYQQLNQSDLKTPEPGRLNSPSPALRAPRQTPVVTRRSTGALFGGPGKLLEREAAHRFSSGVLDSM